MSAFAGDGNCAPEGADRMGGDERQCVLSPGGESISRGSTTR
jgi:hypothetical protein